MLEKKNHEKIQLNSTFFLEQIRRKELKYIIQMLLTCKIHYFSDTYFGQKER